MDFPYTYTGDRWGRNGQPCRLLVRGKRNHVMVEFEDGDKIVTHRNDLMRRKGSYKENPKRSSSRCTACDASLARIPSAPMLNDASWGKLAEQHELLCIKCFFQRVSEYRMHLTLADLKPCPVNLFHRPHSWFDLFAKGESQAVIAAWLKGAESGLPGGNQTVSNLIPFPGLQR